VSSGLRNYGIVTAGYWAFTLTDGAIRMIVVLYFHQLGFGALDIALLFLFYELFGVITNLLGGWLGTCIGLNRIMQIGMVLQLLALMLLSVPAGLLSVAYVMAVQALSGIAKDLNKMSAKASVKQLIPKAEESRLLRWVAILTGSKNALKGAGFFLGAILLKLVGFQGALWTLASMLFSVFLTVWWLLPPSTGQASTKPAFKTLLSNTPAINILSAARFFLFGSRDVWFVVALPVSLVGLGYSQSVIGASMALWIMGYGAIQVIAPMVLQRHGHLPAGSSATRWSGLLFLLPTGMAIALTLNIPPASVLFVGLSLFAIVFAINSALHSYLVLWYANSDRVAMDVGFYYMANAAGRLVGTVLSGALYQWYGLVACLWCSALMVLLASLVSSKLPESTDSKLAPSANNNNKDLSAE
jgi:predicted MFS family arabinose efflux permease